MNWRTTSKILGATGLESDGDKMLGGHYPCLDSLHLGFDRLLQGFFHEGVVRRQELHGPAGDDNVLLFELVTPGCKVLIDRTDGEQGAAGNSFEGDKDIDVEGRGRFQVKSRADSAADGVFTDHAVRLHLVDGGDRVFDVHALREL